MEEKQNGIVLGGVNYSESDKILNIFTYSPHLNETMTKQTFYHEYCHTLQGKYV